jgi:hypothetical protein
MFGQTLAFSFEVLFKLKRKFILGNSVTMSLFFPVATHEQSPSYPIRKSKLLLSNSVQIQILLIKIFLVYLDSKIAELITSVGQWMNH